MATKADLQEALDKANAGRGEDDQIVPAGTTKADLEEALAEAGIEPSDGDTDEKAIYVAAPIVAVITKGNRVQHLYKGDRLPEDVTKESLENLQSLGYLSDEPQQ